jgi:hypothetical protein
LRASVRAYRSTEDHIAAGSETVSGEVKRWNLKAFTPSSIIERPMTIGWNVFDFHFPHPTTQESLIQSILTPEHRTNYQTIGLWPRNVA